MELKEFIKATLTEIIGGVKEAQDLVSEQKAYVAPHVNGNQSVYDGKNGKHRSVTKVEFEVGLTNEEQSEKKAGIGVAFGAFNLGGGNKNQTGDKAITSVKFSVMVAFPYMQGSE